MSSHLVPSSVSIELLDELDTLPETVKVDLFISDDEEARRCNNEERSQT